MKIVDQIRFFFTTYHSGGFNILMHIISLSMHFGIAWPQKKILLVLIAFGLEEMGHWYDYFFRFDSSNKKKSITIIPFKLVTIVIFCLFMVWWYQWL